MKTESNNIRNKILIKAREIVEEEGYNKLSIRKITNRMGYSPGIVYHYFSGKEEILNILKKQSYKRLLKEVRERIPLEENPAAQIKNILRAYIDVSLGHPDEYMNFMFNKESDSYEGTIFEEEINQKRGSLLLLVNNISKGIENGIFKECDASVTSKVIWLAIFGMVSKIIIEEKVDLEQKNKITDRFIEFIIMGLKN